MSLAVFIILLCVAGFLMIGGIEYAIWTNRVVCSGHGCGASVRRTMTREVSPGRHRCVVCDGLRDDYPLGTTNRPAYERCEDCKRMLPRIALKGLQEDPDNIDSIVLLCQCHCFPGHMAAYQKRKKDNGAS